MAITNLEVIDAALREINVISETENASAEQGKFALMRLNQMMESWREDGINNLGFFPQPDTTGNCPIADHAESAVIYGLAASCASKYGASVSIELAANLGGAYGIVLRKAISEALDNTDMSHLPIGQGHFGTRYDITTDN